IRCATRINCRAVRWWPLHRGVAAVLTLAVLMALLALAGLGTTPAARADGDPGSDVLVGQNLFAGQLDLSASEQLQLGDLLAATAKLGAPVRVAIISTRTDLG